MQTKITDYTEKKHKQDWVSYDLAKTNEYSLFLRLLDELLTISIKEKPKVGVGRRGYSLRDKIFSMCIKVYRRRDFRNCESALKVLKYLNYIYEVPCYKSIDNFFNDESLLKILDDLILVTSLPLAKIEDTIAIDSTGFSVSRFERWYKFKWGKQEGKEKVWRKLHGLSGCRTNIIISAKITEKKVSDTIMLEQVVEDKLKFFKAKNFVGDMAYSSKKILEFLTKIGMTPYIPFKKNVTGKSRGSFVWMRMYKHFRENTEYFMRKYHQRSNIETSFHMIKTRLGDALSTKNLIANKNEIKIKALVHNICVLIQEAYESKIDIDFVACEKMMATVKN